MMRLRWSIGMLCVGVMSGCAGSASVETHAITADTTGDEAATTEADSEFAALGAEASQADAESAPRQGDIIDGGTIPRAELKAVLDAGLPRFLQQVQVQPQASGARFVGWRLLTVFGDAAYNRGPVRVGDTVLGVNGRAIERPEQAMAVWEALAQAPLLTFQVMRGEQAYEVRYAIAD